jgi:hypothetical protein
MVNLRQDFIVRKGAQVASNVVIGTYAGVNAAPVGGMIVSGNVGIGTATVDSNVSLHVSGSLGSNDYYMDDTANYPGYAPSLYLNFVGSNLLDSRISFIRASTATYVGADGYIKTAQLNVPRFDYDPSYSPPRPNGLLVEQSSTNLMPNSGNIATWTTSFCSLTANSATSPDTTTTAALMIPSTDLNNNHYVNYVWNGSVGNSVTFTVSIFAKTAGYQWIRMNVGNTMGGGYLFFDIINGVIGTYGGVSNPAIQAFSNGWFRCSYQYTTPSAGTGRVGHQIHGSPSNNNFANWSGDGTSGYYFWGAQVEQLSLLTSYIPTLASTASRAAELVNMPASSSWYNPLSSSLLVEASKNSANDTGFGGIVEINDTSANNRFEFYVGSSTASVHFADNYSANNTDADITIGNFTAGSPYKIAGSISQGSIAASINGNLAVTGTTSNFPGTSLTNLAIGHLGAGTNYHNGWIRSISYWPRSLTSSQLSSITKV